MIQTEQQFGTSGQEPSTTGQQIVNQQTADIQEDDNPKRLHEDAVLKDQLFNKKEMQTLLQKPPMLSFENVNIIEQIMINVIVLFVGIAYLVFDDSQVAWRDVSISIITLEGLILVFDIFYHLKSSTMEFFQKFKVIIEIVKLILFSLQIAYALYNLHYYNTSQAYGNFTGVKCFVDLATVCPNGIYQSCLLNYYSDGRYQSDVHYFSYFALAIMFLFIVLSTMKIVAFSGKTYADCKICHKILPNI